MHDAVDLRAPRIRGDENSHQAAFASTSASSSSSQRAASRLGRQRRPIDDFHLAVEIFDDDRAGFHEIAGIHIGHAVDVADRGMMDMAADDAVGAAPPGFAREFALETADEIDRVLHLELRPGRKRPVGKAEQAADAVEMRVDEQRRLIGPVAEEREPFGVAHDDVELVAMHDEKAPPVGGDMDRVAHDLDAAERQAQELPREFVVIAGHEDHARAAPHFAQQLLDDVVMRLRPIPARFQPPAVDDVADQKNRVGVVMAQEIQHQFGLAAARAKMQIRHENRAIAGDAVLLFGQGQPRFFARAESAPSFLWSDSDVVAMTKGRRTRGRQRRPSDRTSVVRISRKFR